MKQKTLKNGYRNGSSYAFRMRCKAGAVEDTRFKFTANRRTVGNAPGFSQQLGETLLGRRFLRFENSTNINFGSCKSLSGCGITAQ